MLSVQGISTRFLQSCDLEVCDGEIVGLVGVNGAGKTSLMRVILGMSSPYSGVVVCKGSCVQLIDAPFAYPELTASENLCLVARLWGLGDDAVPEALKGWGLQDYARRRFGKLSLGNKQRLGLAGVLMGHPDIIVLDEPANALDPLGVITLREKLLAAAAQGAAILVSSHYLDEVARIAHRIVIVNRGRTIGELNPKTGDLSEQFLERVVADERDWR